MKVCVYCEKQFSDELQSCPQDGHPLYSTTLQQDPFLGRIVMDRYKVLRFLGRGGMGAVYEGRHTLLNRQVAIKVMNQSILSDETAVARFIREAKTAAMLEHPNAVMVYDFGVLEDTGAFIVMEFINGSSLRQLLSRTGALSLKQALSIFAPVCSAVEAAHRLGIIHRDLKPENIMLKEADDGTVVVKVVDFGLAKIVRGEESGSAKLTQTGQIMGTPHYMAPEIFEGGDVDHRVDIYALGVILYEMLTGSPPYTGSLEAVIAGHMMRHPQPVSKLNSTISPDIDEVLKSALHKKPQERVGSAMELLTSLQASLTEDTLSPIVLTTGIVEDSRDTLIKTGVQPIRDSKQGRSSTEVTPLTKPIQERQTLDTTVQAKRAGSARLSWKPVLIAAAIFGISAYAGVNYLNRPIAAPPTNTFQVEPPKVVIAEPNPPIQEDKLTPSSTQKPDTDPKPVQKPTQKAKQTTDQKTTDKPSEPKEEVVDDSSKEDEYVRERRRLEEQRRKEEWIREKRRNQGEIEEMRERYKRYKRIKRKSRVW